MYFDSYESEEHKKAKNKLFNMLLRKQVEIHDKENNKYEIFKGKYIDEFLHNESFVMNYSNKAIFSSYDVPCKRHITSEHTPFCDQKGYFGGFRKLPCEECLIENFPDKLNSNSELASYRPDIAFGYRGIYKVWLEIKHSHPCSENKIEFCYENNIALLEISSKDILEFDNCDRVLVFNKLSHEGYLKDSKEFKFELIKRTVEDIIDKYKYITLSKINKLINEQQLYKRDYFQAKETIIDNLKLKEMDRGDYGEEFKNYLGFKKKKKIYTYADQYEKFKITNKEMNNKMYNNNYQIFKDVADNEFEKNKIVRTKDFENKVKDLLPKEYKNKFDFKAAYLSYGVKDLSFKDNKDLLMKIGVDSDTHRNTKFLIPISYI